MATFDERGRQVPDPRPIDAPSGLRAPLSLHEEIRRFVRLEVSRRATDQGEESFEEADDFDIDDDDWSDLADETRYAVRDMVPEVGDVDASDLAKPEPGGLGEASPSGTSSAPMADKPHSAT